MGREYEPDIFNADCPAQKALDVIAHKWALLIMLVLMGGVRRHSELRRKIPGVSQKVLTQTLRKLEANGLIVRRDRPGFPRFVEYEATPLGLSLRTAVLELSTWAERYGFDVADHSA